LTNGSKFLSINFRQYVPLVYLRMPTYYRNQGSIITVWPVHTRVTNS